MRFIDRERELAFLERKWQDPRAQFIVLWGKRRVGKTELIKQFVSGKPHVYFLSESTNDKEQLHRFSNELGRYFKEPLLETRGFSSWEESFQYVQAKGQRFILAIDEFPYLIASNPAIPSLFQKAWDEYWHDSPVYLIVLGSSMAMMEDEVLGYRSPLYGRRTGQWRVDPMAFLAASQFRDGKPFTDRMAHYGVAGGIPAYWLQFSPESDFDGNLTTHALEKGAPLYDEVEFILREELREPRYYFAILQAVSQGKKRLSEIVNATGLTPPVVNKYLGVLCDLRILERELPVTEDKPLKSKKGLYRIVDEFFQFWFRFVFPRRSELEMGRVQEVAKTILSAFPQYLGGIYERIACEILWQDMDRYFPYSSLGRWWNRNEEIDIIGLNAEDDAILFGEVKWSERPVGIDIYESLKRKAKNVSWGTENRREMYCLFSKGGFTEAMIRRAKEENVFLYEQDHYISNS